MNKCYLVSAALLLMLGSLGWADQNAVSERIQQPVEQSIRIRQATQKEEEQWRAARAKLEARYDQLEAEQQRLIRQRAALAQNISALRARVAAREQQLADIEEIAAQIDPFLEEQMLQIEAWQAHDLPFLTAERQQRLESLRRLHDDPEITVSEKFRKVTEALLVEAEYGHTIEVYQETIAVNGQGMLADIFRLGRVSLFYLSLDRQHCGYFDAAERVWQALPPEYIAVIQAAVEMGSRRRPVDLLRMPIGRLAAP